MLAHIKEWTNNDGWLTHWASMKHSLYCHLSVSTLRQLDVLRRKQFPPERAVLHQLPEVQLSRTAYHQSLLSTVTEKQPSAWR